MRRCFNKRLRWKLPSLNKLNVNNCLHLLVRKRKSKVGIVFSEKRKLRGECDSHFKVEIALCRSFCFKVETTWNKKKSKKNILRWILSSFLYELFLRSKFPSLKSYLRWKLPSFLYDKSDSIKRIRWQLPLTKTEKVDIAFNLFWKKIGVRLFMRG